MGTVLLSLEEIYELARTVLVANGCDAPNAHAVAQALAGSERDGAHGHGLFRLPAHVAALRTGRVNGQAAPKTEMVTPAAVRLDGDLGFAPLAHEVGIPRLADAADQLGVAVLLIRNSFHLYALWPEAEAVAAHDLVGLTCTVHTPMMAPHGATEPFFSTNPLAFAWPRPGEEPYVFDMATSVMSRGEIGIAARDGHSVAEGVGLDSDGDPTTDAAKIHQGGVILPFGGHKGSALATMIELFSAGLVGDYFSYEAAEVDPDDDGPAAGGQLIMAMSPEVLAGPGWQDHGEDFFARLEAIPGVRLPGQRRFEHRTDHGPRQVNAALVDEIRGLL